MKVILLENIKGVGKKDEVINASDGYARNYLFPKKLALEANNENMAKLKAKQSSNAHKKEVEKQEAQAVAKQLETIVVTICVKAGDNGKIFGGVTAKEIAEALKHNHKIDIDKKKIQLKETIKTIGTSKVEAKLYEGVSSTITVKTVAE